MNYIVVPQQIKSSSGVGGRSQLKLSVPDPSDEVPHHIYDPSLNVD